MASSQYNTFTRSFRIGSVFSQTFTTFFDNIFVFLVLSAISIAPSTIIDALFIDTIKTLPVLEIIGWTGLIAVINLALTFSLQVAAAWGVYSALSGEPSELGSSLTFGLGKIPESLTLAIVVFLFGFLIAIPAIILIVILSFLPKLLLHLTVLATVIFALNFICAYFIAIPVLGLEELGIFQTLRRCKELTFGNRLKIFSIILINLVIYAAVVSLVIFIGYLINNEAFSKAILIVINMVMTAFSSVLIPIVYFELRAIGEGAILNPLTRVFD